ncbi:MAG: hypothetical protein ACYS8W_05160 [Planctomycetota bacterium]|jgi:hypothetical protein
MPLAFETKSHGTVAFGFFNIESDMLLLEHYFFFADAFCRNISGLAAAVGKFEAKWKVYDIENPAEIGDLMAAIHGVEFTGFIGDTYVKYPFPEREEHFKQSPEGSRTQAEFREMIEKYAVEGEIRFTADAEKKEVAIGEYVFTIEAFHELINYVCIGGMPRYRDEVKPEYVLKMVEAIRGSGNAVLRDMKI